MKPCGRSFSPFFSVVTELEGSISQRASSSLLGGPSLPSRASSMALAVCLPIEGIQ
jgi:hypothetical protein